jgi:hypothetical protein
MQTALPLPEAVMDYRRSTVLRRAFACATLAIALAGCRGLAERPADRPTMYFDIGNAWTTTKRQVRFYDCRSGSMVCTGPASYLDVAYQCRCE